MVRIHVERIIAAPPDQVFAWLADPANLTAALTSRVLRQGFEQILAGCAKALET